MHTGAWGGVPNGWVAGHSPTRNSSSDHHSELDDNDLQALERLGGLASLIEEDETHPDSNNHPVGCKVQSLHPHYTPTPQHPLPQLPERASLADITNATSPTPRPSPLHVPSILPPSPCPSAPSPLLFRGTAFSDSEPSSSSTPAATHTPNSVEQQLIYCHVLHRLVLFDVITLCCFTRAVLSFKCRHSQRRQPADLSETDIKRLVELQIQQRQPIRPPWYRSRPRRHAQPATPAEGGGQGTGVFCPTPE